MHLEETYTGIMRVASNRDGKPYKDWREYYVDQSGLIMIFQAWQIRSLFLFAVR